MDAQQLSLFDQPLQSLQQRDKLKTDKSQDESETSKICMLVSALSAKVCSLNILEILSHYPEAVVIAQSLGDSRLLRQLNLKKAKSTQPRKQLKELRIEDKRVIYENHDIGQIQLLYKPPLPGELQARLAYESIIDRFLEYLQKNYKIPVIQESDYHISIFIPKTQESIDLTESWNKFIKEIAFSKDGDVKQTLSNLRQTFILMLKSVTLAGRGFSTLEIPIINRDQAIILASLYFAVCQQVKKRQDDRQIKINNINNKINFLTEDIENTELDEKERKKKNKELEAETKQLKKEQEMQDKEEKKYKESFQKGIDKILQEQSIYWNEIQAIDLELDHNGLKKTEINKFKKQKTKLNSKIIFSVESIATKQQLLEQSQGNPFEFIRLDIEQNPDKFTDIINLAKSFNKSATEQINSTRGDIFTQCIIEMYRLLEMTKFDEIPKPLLTIKPRPVEMRTAGDDGKEFCYSCGVALDKKSSQWKVARFMFERPSQRRQSSSSEDRPYICSCCSVLSFASPLKVTDDSIILKLESKSFLKTSYFKNDSQVKQLKLKDYIRGWVTGEMDIISGKYFILNSQKERTSGDWASQKLGLKQYALAKIASKFPLEILSDWIFKLYLQSSQPLTLENRQLIFIKGLMEGYSQTIVTKGNKGQEINLKLGDAIRYVQQDLPSLADYTLLKYSSVSNRLLLEQVREKYYQTIIYDLEKKGEDMKRDPLWRRYKLYEDVAALTGLTYAFAQSLESTARKMMKPEDAEREVSKLIEQIDDPIAFGYYATLGDEKKTSVQARLYHNSDNYFIYDQAKILLENKLGISSREETDKDGKKWLQLYADDLTKAYAYFANPELENNYAQEKDWRDLTYNLKLSLYTRFPELVRKLSSKGDN
ncbi:hypothetical protein [Cyanothece sp. BG0011]|uniref:hypothetical protein n=1 Tax=Cyanothece sp. BG0011 TaxID=2082950 RepID=UPI000D1F20BF|nr:hypothetical protein [Cyanothece sp. BG0011]